MSLLSFAPTHGTRYHYYHPEDATAKEWSTSDAFGGCGVQGLMPSLVLQTVEDVHSTFKTAHGEIADLTVYSSDLEKFARLDYKAVGRLAKQLPGGAKLQFCVTMEDLDELEDACVFGGLEKLHWLRKMSKQENGRKMYSGELLAQVPAFGSGSKSSSSSASAGTASTAAGSGADQRNAGAGGDDDIELAPLPTEKAPGKESCADKPKACANCSCGRSELEDEHGTEKAKEMLETGQVRSACGNCSLGDAFRCASCPYKGTPAFQPGDKVELKNEENDAAANLNKGAAVVQKSGKVQLGGDLMDMN